MENETQFDLNVAARQWRKGLESSPAFRPENLDELEVHVRDSAVALQSRGLTPAESFLIAARRLGGRAELEREFGKANVRSLWLDRCLWMILGLLLYSFIYRLSVPLQSLVWRLAASWDFNWLFEDAPAWFVALDLGLSWEWRAALVGILHSLARFAFPLAGLAAVWWFCMKQERFIVRLAHLSLRRWWLSGLAIVLLLYAANPLAIRMQWLLDSLFGPFGRFPISLPPGIEAQTAILNAWGRWAGMLEPLLLLLLVPLLASYAQRIRTAASRLTSPADTTGIAAAERELVQRLQSQGLSPEEACFLVARRREPRPAVAIEVSNGRQVGVERALWMVVGVVLNTFIYSFLLEPCFMLASLNTRLTNQAAVLEHVIVGLCFLLELGVVAAFGTAFWRFVTRGHRANKWFTSLCMNRPGRAAVGLAFMYVGVVCGSILMATVLTPKNNLGLGDIANRWLYWQHDIIQILIPVALLLWLALSRVKTRQA